MQCLYLYLFLRIADYGGGIRLDANIVLALMLLSHVITDFVLQTDIVAEGKRNNYDIMDKHALHYLFTNIVLVSPYLSFGNNLWCIIIVLTIAHWIIDVKKVEYDKENKRNGLESFALDQLAHLCLIWLSYPLIKDIQLTELATDLVNFFLSHYPVLKLLTKQNIFIYILILAGYLFNFKGATIITKKVLDKYLHLKEQDNSKNTGNEEISVSEQFDSRAALEEAAASLPKIENAKNNAGEAIGNLERLIILTLVMQQNYAAVGMVFAAKTIARYKKLEEKNFAEYFLIGTFTSLIVALLIGEAILTLKSFASNIN